MPQPRSTREDKLSVRQAAGHFAMGAVLGTIAALILIVSNTGAIRELLAAGGASAGLPVVVFVAACACTIAIGATFTGLIFSAMEAD
jgi:hypothetical protein